MLIEEIETILTPVYEQAPAMLALLTRLEWIYDQHHKQAFRCPLCCAGVLEGHKADCELNVVLKAAEECPDQRP